MKSVNSEDYNNETRNYKELNSSIDPSRVTFSLDAVAEGIEGVAEGQDEMNPFEIWYISGIDRRGNKNGR